MAMADGEDSALTTLGKIGTWLKENKTIAIPVAAAVLGFGAASLGRRSETRRSYEDGFESGWDARDRRQSDPELPEHDDEDG
jgi:hypothetical protein